jgi:hypothetical protein
VTITGGGTNPTIHWYVTLDPNFIVAGLQNGLIQLAGGDYIMATGTTYNVIGNTTPSVDITWKSFLATTDVFLVTYVINESGCTDNIKVYKIEPVHVFTLDMDRIAFDGAGTAPASYCVSAVQGAIYNAGVVEMDYGVNYVYFVVNAANWAHSWLPTFQFTTVPQTATVMLAVDWAYPDESWQGAIPAPTWHSTTAVGNIYTPTDPVMPHPGVGGTGVGSDGECIIVRVTVDHNQQEALADILIDFAVDGIMYDQVALNYTNALLGDIHYEAGAQSGQECPWYDGYINDALTYTLIHRPTVTDNLPAPDDFIPTDGE